MTPPAADRSHHGLWHASDSKDRSCRFSPSHPLPNNLVEHHSVTIANKKYPNGRIRLGTKGHWQGDDFLQCNINEDRIR